jgi:hypothetical protein
VLGSLRHHARVALALSTLVAVAATPAVAAGPVLDPERRPAIYVAGDSCHGHTVRPRTITLACADDNLYATGVSFATTGRDVYGTARADASATIHENDCEPYCAAGHFLSGHGTLALSGIVRCADGRLYYSRAHYTFSRGRGEADIEPFERCHVVPGA